MHSKAVLFLPILIIFSAICANSMEGAYGPSESFVVNVHAVIDVRSQEKALEKWVDHLEFKHEIRHLNKHGRGSTLEAYVSAAKKNIMSSIFKKGFVIRTAKGDRLAFFTVDKDERPHFFASVGVFNNQAKISTYFLANNKTPLLTIKDFRRSLSGQAYVADFEDGMSKLGFEKVSYHDYSYDRSTSSGVPEKKLESAINFLDMK